MYLPMDIFTDLSHLKYIYTTQKKGKSCGVILSTTFAVDTFILWKPLLYSFDKFYFMHIHTSVCT